VPVYGWTRGGTSRWRGLKTGLDRRLVDVETKIGQAVANLILAGVDQLPGRGMIAGVRHLLAEQFKAVTQLRAKIVRGELGAGSMTGVPSARTKGKPRPQQVDRERVRLR